MGQKVNPIGFRLGITRSWSSKWFADNNYSQLLKEDINIRAFIAKKFSEAGISMVEIERAARTLKINIHSSRPGIMPSLLRKVLGSSWRKGSRFEEQ